MGQTWTDRALYDACRNEGGIDQGNAFEVIHRDLYRVSHFMVSHTNIPDREAMAKDCAQESLVRVLRQLHTCRDPDKFRAWAKAVTRNHTLNELTKPERKREISLDIEERGDVAGEQRGSGGGSPPDEELEQGELNRTLLYVIARAPMSHRSKRVLLGRYLSEKRDDELAEELSEAEGQAIRPSHIQVTRAKDLKRLQEDERVQSYLQTWR